jgi:hypothetical protein
MPDREGQFGRFGLYGGNGHRDRRAIFRGGRSYFAGSFAEACYRGVTLVRRPDTDLIDTR